MLRVTSGTAKGKKLKTPDLPEFRAVQDKAKLAIFSILSEKVIGAKCVDLYAGSGSLGIEALSRGAQWCDLVETTRTGELTIKDNLVATRFTEKAEIFKQDAVKFVGNAFEKYDIVFADPFYKETQFRFLFENIQEMLKEKGVVVFSHGEETDIKDALSNASKLEIYDQKRYGNAFVTILKLVDKVS